ncbi:MAG: hypothetical protein DLM68_04200 [Hyphomicrobiales bacterium]|nr:MAG: hypothetical protein DLM68_04200 [Hyphomicrobiales bacterium]
MLRRGDNRPLDEIVLDLNRVLRGWSNYFSLGTRVPANRGVDNHVYDRMRNFRARRHKVGTRGTRWHASTMDQDRQLCSEVNRRAGCRKSARPVR